ncbi:hypothetical protein BBP40_004843 [Aspergillus hancockii]|nr:hypothetical protein BBP40_004843 [Aspergillus hancockii]
MEAHTKAKINDDGKAKKLITGFSFGCRWPTPGTNYLEILEKSNVTTSYEAITDVLGSGCVTEAEDEVDDFMEQEDLFMETTVWVKGRS